MGNITRRSSLALAGGALGASLAALTDSTANAEGATLPRTPNADAELIGLGNQFETLAKAYRPLKAKSQRLYSKYVAKVEAAGLEWGPCDEEGRRQHKALMDSTGYHAAYEASGAVHLQLVETMKEIYRYRPSTLAGFAVKARAIAFDALDLEIDPEPHQQVERQFLKLAKAMQAAAGGAADNEHVR